MDSLNNKYYEGFEGEPKIQFIKSSSNGDRLVLSLWDGYFNDIMELIKPLESGWVGLAYYYHLCIGWEEERPWKMPSPNDALQQLKALDTDNIRFLKSKDVLVDICELLAEAITQNDTVWIAKD